MPYPLVVFKNEAPLAPIARAFKCRSAITADFCVNTGLLFSRAPDKILMKVLNSREKPSSFGWEIPADYAVVKELMRALYATMTSPRIMRSDVVFKKANPTITAETKAIRPGDTLGKVRHSVGLRIEKNRDDSPFVEISHITSKFEGASMYFEIPTDLNILVAIEKELFSLV